MEQYGKMVEDMRAVFKSGKTKTRDWRVSQLNAVIRFLTEKQREICEALKLDLLKDGYDSIVDEVAFCIDEAKWFLSNLNRLMKDKKKSVQLVNIGSTAYVHCEPLGVILDIGAWNYPIQIPISTMINIIAAGNCIVIKPSELAENTSKLLANLLPNYMDPDCVKVIEGGVPETTALLKLKWDHVIYTGSGPVGKIVYKAAAEHLTPCTLELGGKCPSYVDAGSDLDSVCNRICWAKFKNAGQTCISVDYIMVQASVEEAFIQKLCDTIKEQYTDNPAQCDSYCQIINDRHFQRVSDLLDSSPGANIRLGGVSDRTARYFSPTVVTGVGPSDRMMQEEIFGPLLPVFAVRDHKEAIDFINGREKALHVNVFSKDKAVIDEFVQRTSSGGVSANDCIIFRIERGLPFGGVGASGFGCYGGDSGFENFSHRKSVLVKPQGMEFLNKMMRYSPHTPEKMKRLQFIFKLPERLNTLLKGLAVFVPAAVIIGVVLYFGITKGASAAAKPEL